MAASGAGWTRYEQLVRRLYQVNLYCAAKLGLENITALHKALGSPLERIPNIVHVGGTNGKGSVAFKIAKSLEHSGVRTGLFVSPHIASFRERMQVDGRLITEAEVVELLDQVLSVRDVQGIPATFFEVTTALAFAYFARRQLGAAVVEVGLGGTLDATNILTPRLSIITSIGLEHTRILGDTIEAIAREKSGIIKPGVPVVLGPKVPHALLEGIAAAKGAPVLRVPTGPYASFEEENTAIARTALNHLRTSLPPLPRPLTEEAVARGLGCRPPCRFEVLEREVEVAATASGGSGGRKTVKVPVVLDVGHNPPALRRLFERLASHFGGGGGGGGGGGADDDGTPQQGQQQQQQQQQHRRQRRRQLRVVLGLSADKDVGACVRTVLDHVGDASRLHVIQALHPRAAKPALLVRAAADLGAPLPAANYGYATIREGIDAALQQAASASAASGDGESEPEVVVVCGTFFIMGDVRQALGFAEPQDSAVIAEVAGAQFAAAQDNILADHPPSPPPSPPPGEKLGSAGL